MVYAIQQLCSRMQLAYLAAFLICYHPLETHELIIYYQFCLLFGIEKLKSTYIVIIFEFCNYISMARLDLVTWIHHSLWFFSSKRKILYMKIKAIECILLGETFRFPIYSCIYRNQFKITSQQLDPLSLSLSLTVAYTNLTTTKTKPTLRCYPVGKTHFWRNPRT